MVEKISKKTKKLIPLLNLPLRLFVHTPNAEDRIDFVNLQEILVIFYAGIGDAVMNIPFLTIIRKNCLNSRITLVCSKGEYEVVKKTNLVDRIIVVDLSLTKKIREILKKIKQIRCALRQINDVKYDIAIEPRGDLRGICLMHKCNSIRKISYNYTGGDNLLTDVIIPSRNITHLIDDQLYLLKSIGINYTENEKIPVLKLNQEDKRKNLKLINDYKIHGKYIIGIHPGASWETKRWKNYGKLAQQIGQIIDGIYFFVFSAKGEEPAANEVYDTIRKNRLNGRIIKEPLEDYLRIIDTCDMMICNDSGAAHIAAAYGIPTIALFGPFDPSSCKPFGNNIISVISHDLPCKPCMSKECKKKNNDCLNGITVDEVLSVVVSVLKHIEENDGDI